MHDRRRQSCPGCSGPDTIMIAAVTRTLDHNGTVLVESPVHPSHGIIRVSNGDDRQPDLNLLPFPLAFQNLKCQNKTL